MPVEDDILQLQADVTALTASLESIRQSLQDQIDLNETSAADADTTADAAVADTIINAQDITALDIALRLYIDSKCAQMRTDIASDFATTLASVEPQIESDVTASFTSQITSVNSTITTQTNAAASSAYNANQSYLNAANVFSSLTQTDIPALQARVTATESTLQSHTNDWTSLLSQYGYTSLQQGFDAQVISTNSAISASATTLKAEIEDPTGSSLGATLNNLYRTEVDTDTAITTAITNVKADIEDPNGQSLGATVNTQATAITDLQTNASAGFLIEAQVDSNGNPTAVSLLNLIAADDPLTGPVSIAKLQADDILLDGTVSARKLQITDFTDYAQLQKFENPNWDDHWNTFSTWGSVALSTGTGFAAQNALDFAASTSTSNNVRADVTVDVLSGKEYQIEFYVKQSANYAPLNGNSWGSSFFKVYKAHNNAQLQFSEFNAGVVTYYNEVELDPSTAPQNLFYKITAVVSVPSDTDSIKLEFVSPHQTGTLSISSLKIISRMAGELIVDGSITANHISATGLDASVITSGEINADNLNINKTMQLSENDAGFLGGRTATSRYDQSGFYVGREARGTATGFEVSTSSVNSDNEVTAFIHDDENHLQLYNPRLFSGGNVTTGSTIYTTVGVHLIGTAASLGTISYTGIGGGGGGGYGLDDGTGSGTAGDGGDTTFRIRAVTGTYSSTNQGTIILTTQTASGGSGGFNANIWESAGTDGQASSFGSGGAGGSKNVNGSDGTANGSGGGGGGGDNSSFLDPSGAGGTGGYAGSTASGSIYVESYQNQNIYLEVITVGAGGTGSSAPSQWDTSGGDGAIGCVSIASPLGGTLEFGLSDIHLAIPSGISAGYFHANSILSSSTRNRLFDWFHFVGNDPNNIDLMADFPSTGGRVVISAVQRKTTYWDSNQTQYVESVFGSPNTWYVDTTSSSSNVRVVDDWGAKFGDGMVTSVKMYVSAGVSLKSNMSSRYFHYRGHYYDLG